jgi:hypothetical protein
MLFLIILFLTLICAFFLPWWAAAIIAFLAAFFIGKTPGKSFLYGFGGIFIAWTILALLKSVPNNNMLAKRVAVMFHLPHWTLLLFMTALIGGLVGGLASLSGILLKKAFTK